MVCGIDSIFEPFLLSLIAGMATGLGGMIVLMLRRVGNRVVSFSMGFASGVMLMVVFNNLFLEAEKLLAHVELIVVFSLGAVMMIILDLSIPHIELATGKFDSKDTKMLRTGMLIAIGITLHNIPEGFVVAASYTYMPRHGLVIAIAIMLHNIPESIVTISRQDVIEVENKHVAVSVVCEPFAHQPIVEGSSISRIGWISQGWRCLARGTMTTNDQYLCCCRCCQGPRRNSYR